MPKSSKRLNVLSSGDLAAGTFTISAEPLVDGDDVMLSVLAATATNSAEPLEYANVCHTIDSEGRYTAVVMVGAPLIVSIYLNTKCLCGLLRRRAKQHCMKHTKLSTSQWSLDYPLMHLHHPHRTIIQTSALSCRISRIPCEVWKGGVASATSP